jgi:hypothetical protein
MLAWVGFSSAMHMAGYCNGDHENGIPRLVTWAPEDLRGGNATCIATGFYSQAWNNLPAVINIRVWVLPIALAWAQESWPTPHAHVC